MLSDHPANLPPSALLPMHFALRIRGHGTAARTNPKPKTLTVQPQRLGLYNYIHTELRHAHPTGPVPMATKAVGGLAAAALGAVVATPMDVALVRMQVRPARGG